MDNQPERPVSLDFVAGLMTGEGTFCLGVCRIKERRGKLRIIPIFGLHMIDHRTVELMADVLRREGLPVYLQLRRKSAGQPQLGIHIAGMRRVERLCRTFIPLLTGQKQEAAELVLEFIESRLALPKKGQPYTEAQLDIVRRLRQVNGNHNGPKNSLESSEAIRQTRASVA